MSCGLAPRLGGGARLGIFPSPRAHIEQESWVFFIFLHIPLRKFWAVLLPRGSHGMEGLKIASKSLEAYEELEIFLNPYRGQ